MAVLDAAERSLPSSYVSRSSPMTYIGPGANTHGLCRQIITPDLNQVRMLCVCVCMCVQIFSHDVHRSWANTHGLCRQIITPDLNQVRVLCVCVLCVCVQIFSHDVHRSWGKHARPLPPDHHARPESGACGVCVCVVCVSRSSPMTYIGPGPNTHGLCRQIITPDLNQVRVLCVCECVCVVACTLIYRGPTDLKHMCAHMLALDIGLCCRWYLREPI